MNNESAIDLLFSPQSIAAYVRAFYSAAITFAGTALISRSTLGISWEDALISAGISALFILGFRGLGEGGYDARREAHNEVKPSDVGAHSAPIAQ